MTQNLNIQPETEQQIPYIERPGDNVEQNPKTLSTEAFLAEVKKNEEKSKQRRELEKPKILEIRDRILKLIAESNLYIKNNPEPQSIENVKNYVDHYRYN